MAQAPFAFAVTISSMCRRFPVIVLTVWPTVMCRQQCGLWLSLLAQNGRLIRVMVAGLARFPYRRNRVYSLVRAGKVLRGILCLAGEASFAWLRIRSVALPSSTVMGVLSTLVQVNVRRTFRFIGKLVRPVLIIVSGMPGCVQRMQLVCPGLFPVLGPWMWVVSPL